MEIRKTDQIIFREDLYPRINADPKTIQEYAENIDVLPPIEINQHDELIDGYHRWTAHRKVKRDDISVTITKTDNEAEFIKLAIIRNASHGLQLSRDDKKAMARKLYVSNGHDKNEIANILSVTGRTIHSWVEDIDKAQKEERNRKIFDMWLSCHSQQEIADSVGITKQSVDNLLEDCQKLENFPKLVNLSATYQDESWKPPLYNIWSYAKLSNTASHFGNSEQAILDNLLYLYTEPFDIVVDPFAGGGSTIDVCKKRLRRYWISDRLPIVERENEIRKHDIVTNGLAGPYHWNDVSLVYLDPPYWKQAENQYSQDTTDLANMPLEQFTNTLSNLINEYANRMSKGVIALLMQPTQWKANNRQVVDHVFDLISAVDNNALRVAYRVSCPYTTEQYNAQQVEWAKENKELLVLTRELIIWKIDK